MYAQILREMGGRDVAFACCTMQKYSACSKHRRQTPAGFERQNNWIVRVSPDAKLKAYAKCSCHEADFFAGLAVGFVGRTIKGVQLRGTVRDA
ncbi:hypothetical protein LBMAG48_02760 [Phycisphaerae bacterium]|nr:hypothetical protein LBMAG48_02760 [Phycisphaerae bacterium]